MFDKKMLAWLEDELTDNQPTLVHAGKVVLSSGAVGVLMFIVVEGKVEIFVGGQVVERVGTGGVFGEMALVDRSPRAASVVAVTASRLLTLGRDQFLALVKANPVFGASLLKSLAERMQHVAAQLSASGK
ncbi:MAG: cyclic nucleotide-binding domain-containing protein [Betaproteobacteria bacterium]|nr:cyclic nucleotide-binding domain-containing protein [Betaproteobacteria bacterium]